MQFIEFHECAQCKADPTGMCIPCEEVLREAQADSAREDSRDAHLGR